MSQPEIPFDIPASHREAVQKSIEIALAAVQKDKTLRVPRSDEDRANGFANWLLRKREQHEPMMQAAVREAFANLAPLDDVTVRNYVDCYVWPEAEHWLLHSIALRSQASWWVSYHLRDMTTIGMPEAQGDFWRIPLGVYGMGENLGQVMLDRDGRVIEHLTSTQKELEAKADAEEPIDIDSFILQDKPMAKDDAIKLVNEEPFEMTA